MNLTKTEDMVEAYLKENWQEQEEPDVYTAKDYTLVVFPSEGMWEYNVCRPVYSRQEPPYDDVIKRGRHTYKRAAMALAEAWDTLLTHEEIVADQRQYIQFLEWEFRTDGIEDESDE